MNAVEIRKTQNSVRKSPRIVPRGHCVLRMVSFVALIAPLAGCSVAPGAINDEAFDVRARAEPPRSVAASASGDVADPALVAKAAALARLGAEGGAAREDADQAMLLRAQALAFAGRVPPTTASNPPALPATAALPPATFRREAIARPGESETRMAPEEVMARLKALSSVAPSRSDDDAVAAPTPQETLRRLKELAAQMKPGPTKDNSPNGGVAPAPAKSGDVARAASQNPATQSARPGSSASANLFAAAGVGLRAGGDFRTPGASASVVAR